MNTYHEAEDALIHVSRMQRAILDAGVRPCYSALDANTGDAAMTTVYHAWIRVPGGAVEHTTLREDEWLTVDVDPIDVDAAIEEWGWCGTHGMLSGNLIVLQAGDDDTLHADALAYLKQGA